MAYTNEQIKTFLGDKGLIGAYKGAQTHIKDPFAIYGYAQSGGVTADQLDSVFGYSPGTSAAWIKDKGLATLGGTNAPSGAGPTATGPTATGSTAASGTTGTSTAGTGTPVIGAKPTTNPLDQVDTILAKAYSAVPQMGAPASVSAERVEAAPAVQAAAPEAVTAEVPYNQTSSGIIEGLLQRNSPYLQRAQALGLEAVNGRGLLSSSIAAGAATGAAIDRAGALATTDAGVYAGQRLANQNAQNEMANANANRQLNAAQFNAQQANQIAVGNADRALQAGQFNANATNEQTLSRFNAAANLGGQLLAGQQRVSEMELGAFLDKDKAVLMNEFQRGNMSLQNYFDLKAMGYRHDLTLNEMGYGAQIQFARDLQQHGFDLEKMAKTQGYNKENLAAMLGIDLQKMAVAQGYNKENLATANAYDLNRLAVAQGFNLEALAKTHGYDMEKVAAQVASQVQIANLTNSLDTQSKKDIMTLAASLDATVAGKTALTSALSNYVNTISAIQSDPNMDAEAKNVAKDLAQRNFYGYGKVLGAVHNADVSEFLTAVGLPQNTPASAPASAPVNTTTTAPQQNWEPPYP